MNIELLRRIQAHNTAHPEQLVMDYFLLRQVCKTTACIAGHACLLSGIDMPPYSCIRAVAEGLLALEPQNGEVLFYESRWPGGFIESLGDCASGTPEYAAIVNARIDRFIETGGAE